MCARRVREATEIVYEEAEGRREQATGGGEEAGRRDHRALKIREVLSIRSVPKMERCTEHWVERGGGMTYESESGRGA